MSQTSRLINNVGYKQHTNEPKAIKTSGSDSFKKKAQIIFKARNFQIK